MRLDADLYLPPGNVDCRLLLLDGRREPGVDQAEDNTIDSLRALVFAGAMFPEPLRLLVAAKLCSKVYEYYGVQETVTLTLSTPEDRRFYPGSVGVSPRSKRIGQAFPVVEDGAHCVLCQQDLDHSAGHRLRMFESFVASMTDHELRQVRETFARLTEVLH